ncbi:TIGR02453 family protein [Cognatiyoonia sp. IB215182]|uniref:TIGR02453 family protein n=1 Tax=Cognatiyoonia sp. IB215182 TaxID=3097353 RepID=UPI002A16B501|nr:TIGR02453 family protein [Cognatiyoonia sp. IB215182]MDX8351816.1 TIGR02453 family protein [Cognatiyoonia sp. IB215182]
MTQFDCFSPDALHFLKELKANNTKDWFAANKARYEAQLKAPGLQFADAIVGALAEMTGQDHTSKVFRIHRDVRFSKDKTPYNAHLHMAFTPAQQTSQPPMWFFGLSPERLTLGCGVFQYDKESLPAFRAAMGGGTGTKLIALTDDLCKQGFRIGEPDLKRVPAGFDKDHPNAEALRRKGFATWIDNSTPASVTERGLVGRTIADLRQLMPVFHLMSEIAAAMQPD